MKLSLVLSILLLFLVSCGPSQEEKERVTQEEKERVAAVTCSIMSETRNMDAAIRVREINDAREKIGGEPFLRGDEAIKEALEWGLCQELVLNEPYYERLQFLKDAKRERERIAAEKRAAENRISEEARLKREEEERIGAEALRKAEEQKRKWSACESFLSVEYDEFRKYLRENPCKTDDDFFQINLSGNGSTTAFTLPFTLPTNLRDAQIAVYINGVYQSKLNYSISGTALTFSTAPPNGSVIEIVNLKNLENIGLDKWDIK